MKFIVVASLLFAVALAAPQTNGNGAVANGNGRTAAGRSISPAAPAQAAAQPTYGANVYGPGLNNPFAFPHNPFLVRSAEALANSHPGLLVRVNVDGEVEFTDRFGREVDGVYNAFGTDLTELYDL